MAQHFSPSADTWLRAAVLVVVAVVIGGALMAAGIQNSQYVTRVARTPPQPVMFSHKHHVAQLGIDCRYCHASVEVAADAGLPGTHVCMSCHSQIWTNSKLLAPVRASYADNRSLVWHRVARVPDYVYFRHDIHVAKGVGCVSCHGHVERMQLTYRPIAFEMRWCLGCHRNPAENLRPASQIYNADWTPPPDRSAYGRKLAAAYHVKGVEDLTHCAVCHR